MPHIDDIRRLWSEGRDVTEIAHVTGHDRKTVRKYLQINAHGDRYVIGGVAVRLDVHEEGRNTRRVHQDSEAFWLSLPPLP